MRLVPRSIAGRTTMVLVAGTLAILAAGAVVSSLGMLEDAAPRRNMRLVERTVTLVSILNAVPREVRPQVVSVMQRPGLKFEWMEHPSVTPAVSHDWFSSWMERRLRRVLGQFDVETVLVGHEPDPDDARSGLFPVRHGHSQMWVELGDGTWLNVSPTDPWHSETSLIYFALMCVIVGGGLAGLAIVVARWVTAPLGLFASAATRLGEDVDAPPMSESGPTEIKKAALAFNQMQRVIRRFVAERMHMVAAASHDLRTPITRLRLRAELIEDAEQRTKMLKDLDEMETTIASTIAFAHEELVGEPRVAVDLVELLEEIRSDLAEAGHAMTLLAPRTSPTRAGRTRSSGRLQT